MHRVLLGFAATAAIVIFANAAEAQAMVSGGFVASSGSPQIRFVAPPSFDGRFDRHRDGRRDHRARTRIGDDVVLGDSGYNLFSSYDDRDWGPDRGNDWWHDRPDRAFPRWISHNQNCTPDRMWWSGSGWHC